MDSPTNPGDGAGTNRQSQSPARCLHTPSGPNTGCTRAPRGLFFLWEAERPRRGHWTDLGIARRSRDTRGIVPRGLKVEKGGKGRASIAAAAAKTEATTARPGRLHTSLNAAASRNLVGAGESPNRAKVKAAAAEKISAGVAADATRKERSRGPRKKKNHLVTLVVHQQVAYLVLVCRPVRFVRALVLCARCRWGSARTRVTALVEPNRMIVLVVHRTR